MLKKGFSIIELIVLMSLIFIVFAISIPKIFPPSEANILAAKDKLMGDIEYAQAMALSHQDYYGIKFDSANESYFLYKGNYILGPSIEIILDPQTKKKYIINYTTDPRFKNVNLAKMTLQGELLQFDAWGRPADLGGRLTAQNEIVLASFNISTVLRIYIEPETGKLTWKRD